MSNLKKNGQQMNTGEIIVANQKKSLILGQLLTQVMRRSLGQLLPQVTRRILGQLLSQVMRRILGQLPTQVTRRSLGPAWKRN